MPRVIYLIALERVFNNAIFENQARKLLLQVCKAALQEYDRVGSANDLVHRIVAPYLKPNVAKLLKL